MASMDKKLTVRTALKNEKDIKDAALAINSGFRDDPIATWIIPDLVERVKVMKDFFALYVRLGIEQGFVHLATVEGMGVVGASIWLPHNVDTQSIADELLAIAGEHIGQFDLFGALLEAHYPPAAPYYQLMAAGVRSDAHGRGVGSALLAAGVQHLDELKIPSYLEATTRRSSGGIYPRFGFQPVGELVHFSDELKAYPMWRPVHEVSVTPSTIHIEIIEKYPLIDSVVQFGNHTWRVLDVQGDKALLLSEKVLEIRQFHERYEVVTWESSTLRAYLNTDFYQAMTSEDRERIVTLPIANYANPWFSVGSDVDTLDPVFLLSIQGVVQYFGDSKQLRSKNANTRYFISDHFNEARKATTLANEPSAWWLRTSGNLPNFATLVTADGRIAVSGDFANRGGNFNTGVRPAVWVSLSADTPLGVGL